MSIQMAPLPARFSATDTDQTTTPGPAPAGEVGHQYRERPNEHLCSCGKLREECVRDRVRALWST
jgi:hypothetical protein